MKFVELLIEHGIKKEEADELFQFMAGAMLELLVQNGGDNLITMPVETPMMERKGFDIMLKWRDDKSDSDLRIEAQERACHMELERDKALKKAKTAGKIISEYKGKVDVLCEALKTITDFAKGNGRRGSDCNLCTAGVEDIDHDDFCPVPAARAALLRTIPDDNPTPPREQIERNALPPPR